MKEYVSPELKEMETDGLVVLQREKLKVTEIDCMFLRNICHAFELKGKLRDNKSGIPEFSKAI